MSSKNAHIVLDALLVNQHPTGVGRSILELTRALASKDRGFHFTVLTTDEELFQWLDGKPGWDVVECSGARGGTLRKALFTQLKIPKLCKDLGADLLHSLQFVAPMKLSMPNVVTVHDLAWLRFPQTVEEPRRTYYRLMVPRTLKNAAAVVTNSAATAADVHQYYPCCQKVRVTPFGTPSWVWQKSGTDEAIPRKRPFFLFVGTLEPRKNLERIIEAYRRLLDSPLINDLKSWPSLVLVGGKGWKDSNLTRLMNPLVASGHLEVMDYCDTENLRQLYKGAQALLFPSLHEGFGFPILEAMAFGLPVMTSGKGAMAEVSGQDALLVDPQNVNDLFRGLTQLAGSEQLRARLALGGPDRARSWSWHKTAAETLAVYSEVLKK